MSMVVLFFKRCHILIILHFKTNLMNWYYFHTLTLGYVSADHERSFEIVSLTNYQLLSCRTNILVDLSRFYMVADLGSLNLTATQ